MLRLDAAENALWLAFAIALTTIAGAWLFEWWGYAPCYLCLLQRWPYYAAIVLLPVAALATRKSFSMRRAALILFLLLFATSALFGFYHAGIEWKWWPGPSTCTAGSGQLTGLPDLSRPVILCDEAALRIFGLSLAGWNAAISAGIAALMARASRYGSSSVSQYR
jgi:disulfide bond formation protein DsbB